MKIIRWFLSHFFLVLLVVAVIYGYMYWGNLAGEKTPAGKAIAYLSSEFVEVDEFIKAVKARQAQQSTEKVPAEAELSATVVDVQTDSEPVESVAGNIPAGDISMESAAEEPVAVVSVTEVEETVVITGNIVQQPVSISYSHNQMRVKQNSMGQIESQPEMPVQDEETAANVETEPQVESAIVESEPVAEVSREPAAKVDVAPEVPSQAATAVTATSGGFVPAKIEQQLNNVDKNGKIINPALKTYAIRDSWITARKSFYQRKYELSEQSYREVINNTTDNYDAYGELGNVYFNQGKNTEAAAAYFEAASILVRKGKISRARSLMGLLRQLDDGKAVDLKKLIDSSAS